jgi:hypothetical protein
MGAAAGLDTRKEGHAEKSLSRMERVQLLQMALQTECEPGCSTRSRESRARESRESETALHRDIASTSPSDSCSSSVSSSARVSPSETAYPSGTASAAVYGGGGASRRHGGVEAVCDTLGRASSAPHVRGGVESLTESGALVSELARTHRTLDDSAREQELQALNVQVAVLEAKIEMLARKSCTCCCLS